MVLLMVKFRLYEAFDSQPLFRSASNSLVSVAFMVGVVSLSFVEVFWLASLAKSFSIGCSLSWSSDCSITILHQLVVGFRLVISSLKIPGNGSFPPSKLGTLLLATIGLFS